MKSGTVSEVNNRRETQWTMTILRRRQFPLSIMPTSCLTSEVRNRSRLHLICRKAIGLMILASISYHEPVTRARNAPALIVGRMISGRNEMNRLIAWIESSCSHGLNLKPLAYWYMIENRLAPQTSRRCRSLHGCIKTLGRHSFSSFFYFLGVKWSIFSTWRCFLIRAAPKLANIASAYSSSYVESRPKASKLSLIQEETAVPIRKR